MRGRRSASVGGGDGERPRLQGIRRTNQLDEQNSLSQTGHAMRHRQALFGGYALSISGCDVVYLYIEVLLLQIVIHIVTGLLKVADL